MIKENNLIKSKSVAIKILMILIIAFIGLWININLAFAANEIVEDEITFVRMSAALSRGADSNSKVDITTLQEYLDQYTGHRYRATVTEKSSTTLVIRFYETGNEYEIDVDKGSIEETYKTTLNLMTEVTWKHGSVIVQQYNEQDAMTFSSSKIYMTYGWSNESGGGSRGGHYGQTASFDITNFKTLTTKISYSSLGYAPQWGDQLTQYVRLYYDGGYITLGSSTYDVSSYTGDAYIYVYGTADGCGGSTTITQLTLSN